VEFGTIIYRRLLPYSPYSPTPAGGPRGGTAGGGLPQDSTGAGEQRVPAWAAPPLVHGVPRPLPLMPALTNDSKATVSVLYWYGNYPTMTESSWL
jgi:hypothetical protein